MPGGNSTLRKRNVLKRRSDTVKKMSLHMSEELSGVL